MSGTRARRRAILEIVTAGRIQTQEELAEALARRGFRVSQASVSRDVAALSLAKSGGRYVRAEAAAASARDDPHRATLARNVLETRSAGDHLVVLITPAGGANPTAIALERQGWPEIVGTLAGDDTVFVAVRDAAASRSLRKRLSALTL
jgi:transcriptional regulator of arginine metabolism